MSRRAAGPAKRHAGFPLIRTMVIVIALLTGAFAGMAWLAKPLPDSTAMLAQSPLGRVLPFLPAKEPAPPFAGLSHLRPGAGRLRDAGSDSEFAVGPLAVGMAFGEFMALDVPQADRTVKAAKKAVIGILRTDKGVFTAYFPSTETKARAFRLSFTATYEEYSEHNIIEYLGDLWGKPNGTECARLTYANGRDCRFQWWPVNGMRVGAQVRLTDDRPDLPAVTTLRIEVIDDRAERRKVTGFRVAENGRAALVR